jgi:hypothetical protein
MRERGVCTPPAVDKEFANGCLEQISQKIIIQWAEPYEVRGRRPKTKVRPLTQIVI